MVGLSLCALVFAGEFVYSFPVMHVWARTLCMEILCGIPYIWCIIVTMSKFVWVIVL